MNEQIHDYSISKDWVFGLIIVSAVILRLYLASASVYIWDEERDWLVLAQSISFEPGKLNFPLRGDFHPAFAAYFMKASSLLFGENPIGFRIFNIISGILTILVAFKTSLEWTGNLAAARWTAFLLAFNEYHIAASVLAVEKSLYLLFVMLSIAAFVRFLRMEKALYLFLTGGLIGITFLCKEIGLLLLPVCLIFLLFPEYRSWFKRRELYLSGIIFLIVIAPDIYWNLTNRASVGERVNLLERLSQIEFGLTIQPFVFYFNDALQRVYSLLHWQLDDPGLDYPKMNLIWGTILFAAVVLATFRYEPKSRVAGFFKLLFWGVFGFFVLMPSDNPSRAEMGSAAFYWVNLTLLPAAVLAGGVLSTMPKRWHIQAQIICGIAALYACIKVFAFGLGLPVLTVGYQPDFIRPDGQLVEVQAKFQTCAICEQTPKIELIGINSIDDINDTTTPAVNSTDVEDALVGDDDRTFKLRGTRGAGERRYEIIYRVTFSNGKILIRDDKPFGTVGVRVIDDSMTRWKSPFWVMR